MVSGVPFQVAERSLFILPSPVRSGSADGLRADGLTPPPYDPWAIPPFFKGGRDGRGVAVAAEGWYFENWN